MTPSSCMNSTAASWLGSSTSATASAGRPASQPGPQERPTTAGFERWALDEPRRYAALPDRRQSPATSLVTFGRFS